MLFRSATPVDLPILVVSGSTNPVGRDGAGVREVVTAYRRAGVQEVSLCRCHKDTLIFWPVNIAQWIARSPYENGVRCNRRTGRRSSPKMPR